jgi:hypothetical protein
MADRYWVGGTASWDGTAGTKWSSVSGGAGGDSVPTTADDVFFDANSTGTCTIALGNTGAKSITCTGFTGTITGTAAITVSGSITLVTGMTWTYTGTLTSNATATITSAGKTFGPITKSTASTTLTLADDFTSTGAFTWTGGTWDFTNKTVYVASVDANNTGVKSIVFGTSGVLYLTGTGTVWAQPSGTNSITSSGSRNVIVNSTGSTSIAVATGGASTATCLNWSFTGGTYSLSAPGQYRNLDLTGFGGALTSNNTRSIFENLTFSNVGTFSTTSVTFATTFNGTGTQTVQTFGKTINFPIIQNGSGGTLRLLDSLTLGSSRSFTHTNGTLNLNGNTLTIATGASYTTAAGTKNITFNSGILVCPATGTAFNNAAPTNYTTTAGTGTGEIRMTAATGKTFAGGGSTFNCTLSNNGAGALTITGSNTFTTLANGVQPTTFTFTAGTTTTVTNWSVSGTAGNLVTINSATAAAHTLSKASGTVSADYLSIQDSTATGGAAWYAGANSTNVSGNTGWIFTAPPAGITASMAASEVGADTFTGSATITAAITASMAASEVGPDILAANAFIGYAVTAAMAASEVGPDIFVSSAYIGTPPPPVVVDVYLIKLRSFTEHRRF